MGWRYILGFFTILAFDMLARKHYETHHQGEVVILLFFGQLVIFLALLIYYLLDD